MQATHGRYDARAVWAASLAISRRRLAGGGRGCSQATNRALATAADAAHAAKDDLRSLEWFGGSLDADGYLVVPEDVLNKMRSAPGGRERLEAAGATLDLEGAGDGGSGGGQIGVAAAKETRGRGFGTSAMPTGQPGSKRGTR